MGHFRTALMPSKPSNRAVRGLKHAQQEHWCGAYIFPDMCQQGTTPNTRDQCVLLFSHLPILGPSVSAVRNFGFVEIT